METQEGNSFVDRLYSSTLQMKLVNLAKPIVADHIHKCIEDKTLNYSELGNDGEKKIKNAIAVFTNLQTVIEDLDKVIYFLSMTKEDAQKIYPSISLEDYYNYHLENYVIRVNSIPDVLAGLGNLICGWGINSKSCYGTSIPNSPQIANQDIKDKMSSLLSRTHSIRNIRNKKVHSGSAEIDYFEQATVWDSLKSIGITLTPELEQYSKEKKIEAIEVIKSEINGVLDDVIALLDIMSSYVN